MPAGQLYFTTKLRNYMLGFLGFVFSYYHLKTKMALQSNFIIKKEASQSEDLAYFYDS